MHLLAKNCRDRVGMEETALTTRLISSCLTGLAMTLTASSVITSQVRADDASAAPTGALMLAILGTGLIDPAQGASHSPAPPEGWTLGSPRTELLPVCRFDSGGGRSGRGAFVIAADDRQGLHGWWAKTFTVKGERFLPFYRVPQDDGRRGSASQCLCSNSLA